MAYASIYLRTCWKSAIFKAIVVDLGPTLGVVISDPGHLWRGHCDLLHIVMLGISGAKALAKDVGRGVAGKLVVPFVRLVVPEVQMIDEVWILEGTVWHTFV